MFSEIMAASIQGIDACKVMVEVDVSDGMPCISMVGSLSTQVRESQDRVRTAMRNAGLKLPVKRVTINLSPADVRKEGTGFDLPIAIGMLVSFGFLPQSQVKDILFVGELSLDGRLIAVRGVLEIVLKAVGMGAKFCIVPMDNLKEGSVVQGIKTLGAGSLMEVYEYLLGMRELTEYPCDPERILIEGKKRETADFSQLRGQKVLRRAAEISVTGRHNLLMIGPPGAGKTMTARLIPTILPPLSVQECLQISAVHSIAGTLPSQSGLVTSRPFRAPHHTTTTAALAGGGKNPVPGEISLAHGGVLFLDELPEFPQRVLDVLRQPLEEGVIRISRNSGNYVFPADFMLVAAMNPCKCGYFPDRSRCRCTTWDVRKYLGQISQPLLDRFDVCVESEEITYAEIASGEDAESSEQIRKRVDEACARQKERYQKEGIRFNRELSPRQIRKYCALGPEQQKLMKRVYEDRKLTGRSYMRILKVARTIADLSGSDEIRCEHLAEAVGYRSLDQKYWGGLD